jgi:hypothetical protein
MVFLRVGQNHIYTVYIRCFWQGNHHTYGHIRCRYTVLANHSLSASGLQLRLELQRGGAGASVITCHLGPVLSEMVSPSFVKQASAACCAPLKIIILCRKYNDMWNPHIKIISFLYNNQIKGAPRTLAIIH